MDLVAAYAIVIAIGTAVSLVCLVVAAFSAMMRQPKLPDLLKGLSTTEVRLRLDRAAKKGECLHCRMGTFAQSDARLLGSHGVVAYRCSNCGFAATRGPGWWSL